MNTNKQDTILICWNNGNFRSYIKAQMEKLSFKVVLCSDDTDLDGTDWSKITYIIVLCELKWAGRNQDGAYSDMNGIKLVQHLRRDENVKIPVLFVSFLSRKMILDKHPDVEIICTPALKHGFCQLPSKTNEWKDILESLTINNELKNAIDNCSENEKTSHISKELTELELKYTQRRFCGIIGLLEQINHDISSCSTTEKLKEKLKVLRYVVNKSKSVQKKSDIDDLEIKIHKSTEADFREVKFREDIHNDFKKLCKQIKDSIIDNSVNNKQESDKKYRILFIDDDYQTDSRISELIKAMESQGFHVTKEPTPRYDFRDLEGNRKENRFDAIISDIEIKAKADNGEIEELQYLGFNYVRWLQSSFDRIFIILSNVTRNLYNDIIFANDSAKNVYPFQKDVYICSDAARQEFINKVKDLIDHKRSVSSKNKGGFDENSVPLKYFRNYIGHLTEQSNYGVTIKNFSNYENVKQYIESTVRKLHVKVDLNKFAFQRKGKEEIDFALFIKENVGELGDKRTENPRHGRYSPRLSNNFINTLIARRLLIYTILKTSNNIDALFTNKNNDGKNTQRQYPQTQYCFPSNISRQSIIDNKDNTNLFSTEEILYIRQLLDE